MTDLSIKLAPKSRSQRRELDRAAHAAGLKTGPWCLSVALKAARVGSGPKAAPAANTEVKAVAKKDLGDTFRVDFDPTKVEVAPGTTLTGRSPLIRTYDPDQP